MKKVMIGLIAFTLTLSAADFSGIWNGKGGIESAKYGSIPQTAQMTLLQAGNSVSGTLKIGNAENYKIVAGTVTNTQITFGVGTSGSAVLTQNGDKLQGRITSSDGSILDVVFTK